MKNVLCSAAMALTLGLSALQFASAADVTAIVGVHVAPMDDERILRDHTVIVEDGRIAAVGPRDATPAPDGAEIIDGAGRYLIPGLAEMHGHLPSGGADAEDTLFLYVAGGVTLVRGMLGNEAQFAFRDRIMDSDIIGPTLYLAAPSINGNNTKSPAAAREKVRQYKADGWDLLKVHEGLSTETYNALADEANSAGIPFAGHVPDAPGLARALENGQRTIDHMDNYISFMGADDSPVTEEGLTSAVEATLAAGAGVVPTAALWEHFVGEPADILEFEELRYVAPETRRNWAQRIADARAEVAADPQPAELMISNRRKLLKALSDGGVEVLLGSDAPQFYSVPGFSIHREMDVMAQAGMTPYEILRSGTAVAGAYFADDMSGVIAPGARADLVLLGANPLEDIANAALIEGVMLRGTWLPKAGIDARLEEIAAKHN